MIKELAIRLLGHRLGWKTKRKLLIFESDDWGSLYLPDAERTRKLVESGILPNDAVGYERFDCLETTEDLEGLCNVLIQFRDSKNRHPKFTFDTVMGNPDFEKIQQSGFQQYVHQSLFDSYIEYTGKDVKPIWFSAMDQGLMVPQFHAREHVNVPRWMRDLRSDRPDIRIAFDNRYFALRRSNISPINYLTAYWPDSIDDLKEIERITTDGLTLFEKIFGFPSKTMVACAYILPEEVEKRTAECGVEMIQTQRRYRVPVAQSGNSRYRSPISGWKNPYGQVYSVRNVAFEPTLEPDDCVNRALSQVSSAFGVGKPAIVCSHRVNYVGSHDKQRRDLSLNELRRFLQALTERFPDIEFISSNELIEEMSR
jgi:hypothetical protein